MRNYVDLIVTRHPALLDYLQELGFADDTTMVMSHVTAADIEGLVVAGVLPFHLAARARRVLEVPLHIPQEMRGVELTLNQIREFAGPVTEYSVHVHAAHDEEV